MFPPLSTRLALLSPQIVHGDRTGLESRGKDDATPRPSSPFLFPLCHPRNRDNLPKHLPTYIRKRDSHTTCSLEPVVCVAQQLHPVAIAHQLAAQLLTKELRCKTYQPFVIPVRVSWRPSHSVVKAQLRALLSAGDEEAFNIPPRLHPNSFWDEG